MFCFQDTVYVIEYFAVKPVMLFHLLFYRLTFTKFTNHISSVKAYAVTIIKLLYSLNLQVTCICLPSFAGPSILYLVPLKSWVIFFSILPLSIAFSISSRSNLSLIISSSACDER